LVGAGILKVLIFWKRLFLLSFTKHHEVKAYGGSGGQYPRLFSTSALDAIELSTSRPGRFTIGQTPPPPSVKHRVGRTANQNPWDKNKHDALSGIKPRFLGSPARGLVTMNVSFPNLCVCVLVICLLVFTVLLYFVYVYLFFFIILFNFMSCVFFVLCLCILFVMNVLYILFLSC
jgi:hypothetical protein